MSQQSDAFRARILHRNFGQCYGLCSSPIIIIQTVVQSLQLSKCSERSTVDSIEELWNAAASLKVIERTLAEFDRLLFLHNLRSLPRGFVQRLRWMESTKL